MQTANNLITSQPVPITAPWTLARTVWLDFALPLQYLTRRRTHIYSFQR